MVLQKAASPIVNPSVVEEPPAFMTGGSSCLFFLLFSAGRPASVERGYNLGMPQSILIVEDEIELAKIIRDYLENAGFRVDSVGDG